MHEVDLVDTVRPGAGAVVYAQCSCGWRSGDHTIRRVAQLAADYHSATEAERARPVVRHG